MMRHEGPIGSLWTVRALHCIAFYIKTERVTGFDVWSVVGLQFNADYGYLEAVLRGFRSGFLKDVEYRQICQCENLEDVKLALGDTDYLNVLQNQAILTPDIMVYQCIAFHSDMM